MFEDLMEEFDKMDEAPKRLEKSDKVKLGFGYVGSKFSLLEKLSEYIPDRQIDIDACGGGGSWIMNRKPKKLSVYNDKHSGVVAFFRCLSVKELKDEFLERIKWMVYSAEEFKWAKESWPGCTDIVERAARWYYTIRTSFASKQVVFGRDLNGLAPKYGDLHDFYAQAEAIHKKFVNIQIENDDVFKLIDRYDTNQEDDIVARNIVWFFDPPYVNMSTNTNTDIYEHSMTAQQHRWLCEKIMKIRGFVALCGYPNSIYDTEFDWDERIEFQHSKTFKHTTVETTEVLWIKDGPR
jgi:DNA adenine methylase